MHWKSDFVEKLAQSSAIWITVLQAQGSVPRGAGTVMVVFDDAFFGTIGGGHLEFEAIAEARQYLKLPKASQDLPKEKRFALGPSLGQCCGGALVLNFESVSWQDKDRLVEYSKKFCQQHNVVNSKEWANIVLEEGLQGASTGETNVSKRLDVRQKMSQNSAKNHLGKFGEDHPSFKGWYVTPLGRFPSLKSAAEAHKTSLQNIHYGVYGYSWKYKGQTKFSPPRQGWYFEVK